MRGQRAGDMEVVWWSIGLVMPGNTLGNKIRSPFHAVTDWIYCPEAPGSPWPDFISPLFITKYNVLVTIFFSFCVFTQKRLKMIFSILGCIIHIF